MKKRQRHNGAKVRGTRRPYRKFCRIVIFAAHKLSRSLRQISNKRRLAVRKNRTCELCRQFK